MLLLYTCRKIIWVFFGNVSFVCGSSEGFQKKKVSRLIQLVDVVKHVLQSVKPRVMAGIVSQPKLSSFFKKILSHNGSKLHKQFEPFLILPYS